LLVLDFDEKGLLDGLEVLSASKRLPPGVLENAETPGPDASYWYEA